MNRMTEPAVTSEVSKVSHDRDRLSRKSPVYMTFHTLAIMAGGTSSVAIKQVILPFQVSLIDPIHTNTSFTLIASIGAFAGLIASPLLGALSDRTTLRFGRRRTWMLFGIMVAVIGMLIMAQARTIPVLLVGEILAQIGVDTLLATVTAILPDQVPISQRALLSACIGMAPNVGGVVGLIVVTRLTDTNNVAQGYYLLAGISVLCVTLFFLVLRERPLARKDVPPFHLSSFLVSFVRPLRSQDFALTLASRCFVYLGFTMLNSYLFFYLRFLHRAAPAQDVATFQMVSTATLLIVAMVAGLFARWIRIIKPYIMVGALFMTIGFAIMAVLPLWTALLIAAVLYGAGFGCYLGRDIELAVRVLPSSQERGKDLGILYTAIFAPLILSTLIGGSILNLTHDNYALLLSIAACSCVLAGVSVLPIKAIR